MVLPILVDPTYITVCLTINAYTALLLESDLKFSLTPLLLSLSYIHLPTGSNLRPWNL